jgi:IclR helix-turn-helix domain
MTLPAELPRTPVGVLDRAMAILAVVEGGARSHTEVARLTGLARPTAHRLLKAMEAHGLVSYIGGQGFRLGPRLLGLAATAMRELPLRDLAQPVLERPGRVRSCSCGTTTSECVSRLRSREASSGRSSRSAPNCRSRQGRPARCSSRTVLRRSPRSSLRPPIGSPRRHRWVNAWSVNSRPLGDWVGRRAPASGNRVWDRSARPSVSRTGRSWRSFPCRGPSSG